MRVAIISDAHGNFFYFQKCMKQILSNFVDKIIYLGDAYGYFEDGDKIIEALRKVNAYCLMGNHEAMLLGEIPIDDTKDELYQLKENIKKLDILQKKFLHGLKPFYEMEMDNHKFLFVHGQPYNPLLGYCYPDDNVEKYFSLSYNAIFMGHTHRVAMWEKDTQKIVNVGSCGLPRDIGNKPSYVILETDTLKCDIVRVEITYEEIEDRYKHINGVLYQCLLRK